MKAIKVPAPRQQDITVVDITGGFESMAALIGNGCRYIEKVNCVLTPEFNLVMVVDEDGLMNTQQHQNPRGQMLYPFSPIVGDVLVMAMGWVVDGMDFVDLPDPDAALALVRASVE